MIYLVIDAALSGTGIRNKYEGGYINPQDLGLSLSIKQRLKEWVTKYANEHYNGFTNEKLIKELDQEGREISIVIKNELSEAKIEYFSNAKMTNEMV
ncbi:MAG: hypothetical protein ACTHMM_13250 [Agriterribacter sp.]